MGPKGIGNPRVATDATAANDYLIRYGIPTITPTHATQPRTPPNADNWVTPIEWSLSFQA